MMASTMAKLGKITAVMPGPYDGSLGSRGFVGPQRKPRLGSKPELIMWYGAILQGANQEHRGIFEVNSDSLYFFVLCDIQIGLVFASANPALQPYHRPARRALMMRCCKVQRLIFI